MDKKNCMQYSVAVVATMSAGKSTLLNALMVEDLLPTNIMACTSTVFAIIDDDKAEKFMGRHISGCQISQWEDIDREKLIEWNEEHYDRIELKGNMPVLMTEDQQVQVTFLDTPGPNNSTNIQHSQITTNLIENHDYSCVVCVLNARALSTNNEAELLAELKVQLDERKNFNIFFALNQIDELDIEQQEYPYETIKELKNFLVKLGFNSPVVIPTSAKLSMNIRNIHRTSTLLSEEDVCRLLPFTKKYKTGIPAYRCTLSRNKQNAIVNTIQLLWTQRKYYRQCLHDDKTFLRPWLAIRGMGKRPLRQILIGDTFFTTDFLGKIDLLCGTAFLEKTIELDMLKKLNQSPSTYSLRKKIRMERKLKNTKKNNKKRNQKNA